MCLYAARIIIILIVFLNSEAVGELVYRTTVGDTVPLSCSTAPGTSVSWQYRSQSTEGDRYLCIAGNVMPNYTTKLTLTGNRNGDYALTINSVTVNDSGVYTCTEDDGLGQKTSIRLDVRLSEFDVTSQHTPSNVILPVTPSDTTGSVVVLVAIVAAAAVAVVSSVIVVVSFVMFKRRKDKRLERQHKQSDDIDALLNVQPCSDSQVINKYVFVSGLTILDRKLYMLRGSLIQEYETGTGSFQIIQGKSFKELHRHYRNDITSSEKNKCIYISDYLHNCIHKLQNFMLAENEEVSKWPVKYRPSGLSVTKEGNLLITCVDDNKLTVLSPSGTQQLEIRLEFQIEMPLHAVENPAATGEFFVCHSGDGVWLVEVNAEGHGKVVTVGSLKKSYGGQTRSCLGIKEPRELAWPCHMAAKEDGSLYVADKYNNRVVLLSSELELVRVVNELHRPRRLCLDAANQRLYIGQNNGETISASILDDSIKLCSDKCPNTSPDEEEHQTTIVIDLP